MRETSNIQINTKSKKKLSFFERVEIVHSEGATGLLFSSSLVIYFVLFNQYTTHQPQTQPHITKQNK